MHTKSALSSFSDFDDRVPLQFFSEILSYNHALFPCMQINKQSVSRILYHYCLRRTSFRSSRASFSVFSRSSHLYAFCCNTINGACVADVSSSRYKLQISHLEAVRIAVESCGFHATTILLCYAFQYTERHQV